MNPRPTPRRSKLAGQSPITPPSTTNTEQPPSNNQTHPTDINNKTDTQGKKDKSDIKKLTDATDKTPTKDSKDSAESAHQTPPRTRTASARVGIYLSPDDLNDAKAAYLADWNNGGQVDTFARWISQTIQNYAALTPEQRSTAEERGRATERTSDTRTFNVQPEAITAMRQAIVADNQANRWPSESSWCKEAIKHAVALTRAANQGALPTPPKRLPNRLVR